MRLILNNTKPTKPLEDGEGIYEVRNLLDSKDLTTVVGTKYEVESYIDTLMEKNESAVYQYDEIQSNQIK